MPEHEEFDLLVQSALASYAEPDPASGLEERILARIAAEDAPETRRRWLPWAIALPVAAGLLLMLVLSGVKHIRPLTGHTDQAPRLQVPSTTGAGSGASNGTLAVKTGTSSSRARSSIESAAANAAPLPKLEVFPTPQPLSPGERALAEFAARATVTERQALVETQKKADAPLSIAAIEIQPLSLSDRGDN